MYRRPLCSNPKVIFNRASIVHILNSSSYVLNGKVIKLSFFTRDNWSYDFPFKRFSRIAHSFETITRNGKKAINWEAIEQSYCGYDSYGNKNYLFIAVPCGHCNLCCDTRQNDFIARCQMENQTSVTRPIMVTLTYSPQYLPFIKKTDLSFPMFRLKQSSYVFDYQSDYGFLFNDVKHYKPTDFSGQILVVRNVPYVKDYNGYHIPYVFRNQYDGFKPGVYKRDVQLFLKRLRILWTRSGRLKKDLPAFRYCCFGELGKKYNRPHYHFIFWNVPYNIKSNFGVSNELKQLHDDILSAWRMCIKSASRVEIARNAAAYVSKYISKNLTSADKPGFMLASNRHGGIGYPFLSTKLDYLRSHPSMSFISYVDKWSGKLVKSTMGRYVTRKVYPSPLSLLPSSFKQLLRQHDRVLGLIRKLSHRCNDFNWPIDIEQPQYHLSTYSRYLPSLYSHSEVIEPQYINQPTWFYFMDFYNEVIRFHNYLVDKLQQILPSLPSINELDYAERLRKVHVKYLLLSNPTDDSIYIADLKIRQKHAIRDAKLVF